MKTMAECYNANETWGWSDYTPMIEAFGEVIVRVDEGDYQGDTWAIIKGEDGKFGYLCFGWGSCSGCDALQSCSNIADVQDLADAIYGSIEWHDTKEALAEWFIKKDWKGQYAWRSEDFQRFIREVGQYLDIVYPIL